MTREEAIERLNIHKSTSVFVDSIAEAIDMAIEALSAEPKEKKDDDSLLTDSAEVGKENECKLSREDARYFLQGISDMISLSPEAEMSIDMAIEALQREEAEEKGYCHRIKPKEYFKNDAMQKLREIPRYLNGVKEKQITKISADDEPKPKWNCTANFVAEQLERLKDMTDEERVKLLQTLFPSADAVHGEWEHWGSPFSDESEVIDTIVCSVCGARFIEPKDEPKGEYNFCPNCGAKMDKGGDTE